MRLTSTRHAEKNFDCGLQTGDVFINPVWNLPASIAPGAEGPMITKSLYDREGSLNNFEHRVILGLANLKNIVFWHRNLERGKGFSINGFNSSHYPDFILLTSSCNLILLETKGDHLDNSNSAAKIRPGYTWAEKLVSSSSISWCSTRTAWKALTRWKSLRI